MENRCVPCYIHPSLIFCCQASAFIGILMLFFLFVQIAVEPWSKILQF
uniref:Uncharacterized protein n=1 Tax=Arundo donax TaxID=35708 RepID=A0A0A9EPD5_ARUDO